MNSSTLRRTTRSRIPASDHIGSALLVVGGVTFIAGGATHPSDSGQGNKVHQLHQMLLDPMWYPSHLLLLAAMAGFAVGVVALRRRPDLGRGMQRLVNVVSVIACIASVAMTFHLLAAVDADALADGEHSLFSRVQTVNETIVDGVWGLAIAALALAGGLTRTVGNRATLLLGLVGGLTFSLASATIAFTDRFDPLFPLASLAGVWGMAVGLMGLWRKA